MYFLVCLVTWWLRHSCLERDRINHKGTKGTKLGTKDTKPATKPAKRLARRLRIRHNPIRMSESVRSSA
jgi:hypothetical protein